MEFQKFPFKFSPIVSFSISKTVLLFTRQLHRNQAVILISILTGLLRDADHLPGLRWCGDVSIHVFSNADDSSNGLGIAFQKLSAFVVNAVFHAYPHMPAQNHSHHVHGQLLRSDSCYLKNRLSRQLIYQTKEICRGWID
jgi:hypothetical protein